MYRDRTVAVVVPAYNEEGFVGTVVESIPEFVDRIYVVDDCSTDGTWDEILAVAERGDRAAVTAKADGGIVDGRVVPIRHEVNRGVGGAIKTGYQRALEDEMDVTAVIAGDGQMDPSILDRFIVPIIDGEADYTKGNRLCSEELHTGMSGWRRFGNVTLTLLTKVASGYWETTDPQNGYTAVSLDVLETVDIERLYDRYGFLNDLLVRLNAHEFRVADVPMRAVYGEEESDIAYTSFVPRLSMLLLVGFCWRLRTKYLGADFHPLVVFYLLGAGGGVAALWYALAVVLVGGSLVTVGLTLVLLLLSGALGGFAMVLDMRANDALDTQISS